VVSATAQAPLCSPFDSDQTVVFLSGGVGGGETPVSDRPVVVGDRRSGRGTRISKLSVHNSLP